MFKQRGNVMANYAFRDKERKIKIYANDCTYAESNEYFYCKTPNCKAKMKLVDLKGVKTSYFRAIPAYSHTEEVCNVQKESFERKKYVENKFDFEQALVNLMNANTGKLIENTGKVTSKPKYEKDKKVLRTIKQIYNMCINNDINDFYNGVKIWRMLVDVRSLHIYKYGIKGLRLVECKVVNYDKERNIINAMCPINRDGKYKLQLKCNDSVFNKLINEKKLDFHKESKSIIVVAGDWKSIDENTFTTDILSKSQIGILKKDINKKKEYTESE